MADYSFDVQKLYLENQLGTSQTMLPKLALGP